MKFRFKLSSKASAKISYFTQQRCQSYWRDIPQYVSCIPLNNLENLVIKIGLKIVYFAPIFGENKSSGEVGLRSCFIPSKRAKEEHPQPNAQHISALLLLSHQAL